MGARNRDAAVAASWQQHHRSLFAPRRSAGTAAAARSCGVAAATATMCAEHSRNDVRCRCVPRHSVAPSHLRFAPSSNARSAHSVAPSHLQSLFEGWHGVVVRSLDRQGTAPRVAKALNLRGVWPGLRIKTIYIYKPSPNKPSFYDRHTDTHTDGQNGYRKLNPPCTRMYTHPFFEATPPGAAPGPPVKNRGPCSSLPGGVIIAQTLARV